MTKERITLIQALENLAINKELKDNKITFKEFKLQFIKSASFYSTVKNLMDKDKGLLSYFLDNTPKSIYDDIFTDEKEKAKYPLTIDRKRTPIGDQINNLKRYAKKLANEASDQPVKKKAKTTLAIATYLGEIEDNKADYSVTEINSIVTNMLSTIKKLTDQEWILKPEKAKK